MPRRARQIECSEEDRTILHAMLRDRKLSVSRKRRVAIILDCCEGMTVKEIASKNFTSEPTVIKWRNRFLESGLPGLYTKKILGRPAKYTEEFRKTIFKTLEKSPPPGFSHWNGALLAQVTGYSKDAIWRLLRKQRICLQRKRSWCVSTDPEFTEKAADIVGLYIAPPENAIVICVDEKPNIQILERSCGYAVSSDKKLVRGLESTYTRHGTLNLFAALEVATGFVHASVTESSQKTKKGFLAFLDEVLAGLPTTCEYHVIMDNHSIHKRHELWLLNHENVYFHYTPTSASWMNMVEIWFGILTLKSLRGASFANASALCSQIYAFQKAYNQSAHPFIWKKRQVRGAQLANSIKNFCN